MNTNSYTLLKDNHDEPYYRLPAGMVFSRLDIRYMTKNNTIAEGSRFEDRKGNQYVTKFEDGTYQLTKMEVES